MSANLELPFGPLDTRCGEAYFERSVISADEMAVMEELADRANWAELLQKEGTIYVTTPFLVLEKVEETEVIMYCLTLLYDLLTQHAQRAATLLAEAHMESFGALSGLIFSSDEVVAGLAARILAVVSLLVKRLSLEDAKVLLEWIDASLRMYPDNEQRVLLATLLLEHVLRVPQLCKEFVGRTEALKLLTTGLIKSRNVQIQYQAIFALWLLSFNADSAALLQTHYGVIPTLLDVARAAIKEKVVRICIATWRNFLSKCPTVAVPVMIGAKVLEYLETLSGSKIADEEAAADVTVLKEELLHAYQSLNSFEEYASEVKSGKLEWSPPHKSEMFWKDNAASLAENDYDLLRCLRGLLDPDNDPQILAIAANDVGMYVSFHTTGRHNIELLGIKQKIMLLISHADSEVRYQALTAMQKYMKKLWNPA